MRRRLGSNIQELWNYIQSELTKIRKKLKNPKTITSDQITDVQKEIDLILDFGNENKNSLLTDWEHLKEIDGYDNWRYKEAALLSNLVQKRLYYLQNPDNCNKARKLVCRLNKVSI